MEAVNPKIVVEVDVIRMCFFFAFKEKIFPHLYSFPVLSPFAVTIDV